MKIEAVKGTRDFYPEEMRLRNRIMDAWRRVSLRNGFEEYDAPIFEYLDLFTAKSGPEIVEQLFNFTDRGGRLLAIRPEITPSLARMVNAKISALPRPIKWFSMPRLCRAERPQKGRLREFFQWNIDVIGEDSELADVECIYVAIDALKELGLTQADVAVRYSSRAMLSAVLTGYGLDAAKIAETMTVLDKRSKIPPEAFTEMLVKTIDNQAVRTGLMKFLDFKDLDALSAETLAADIGIAASADLVTAVEKLRAFRRALADFGIATWCRYDTGVVRGLAYYTGVVYEVFDAGQSLRAVAGGGRYDNLLEVLGGPKVGACGFGMGDVVLGILLQEKGKIPASAQSAALDYYVIDGEGVPLDKVLAVVSALRSKGLSADFSYKRQAMGKQIQSANRRGARKVLIVRSDGLAVKDLTTGAQAETTLDALLA